MFSTDAKKNANACRFCWMCRHLCPIGLVTGKETNTPRAKGLMISMVERGYSFTKEMAADMYECCLCNACAGDCMTGFDPPVFIREARTNAVVEGFVPPHVQKLIDNFENTNNIYGIPFLEKFKELSSEMKDLPEQADILLYIGDTAAYKKPEIVSAVMKLLDKAGVSFMVLKDEGSSGTELGDLIGYVDDVRLIAKETAKQINAANSNKVVVLDPHCARIFKQEYGEWNCNITSDVVTITTFIAELIKNGKLKPKKLKTKKVTFHDPCKLGRDLEETEPAREIMRAMGLDFKEMFLNGKMTKCCGGVIVNEHSPNLSKLTAEGRWQDVERAGADLLLTACPGCLEVMKKETPVDKQVEDIFILLAQLCDA